MTRPGVFIDGHVGTVGLRIHERLRGRDDLRLLTLDEQGRKDAAQRKARASEADLVVLCLPDAAAVEAVEWTPPSTRILDASTAHRVHAGFVYGLPELEPGQRERIAGARCVTSPGCYPTATALLLRPLVEAGLLSPDAPLAIHALSGYSGGGRSLIERWEDPGRGLLSLPYEAPYALERVHKHVPEMVEYARLAGPPQFVPAVGPFECGMRAEIPLPRALLASQGEAKKLWDCLETRYAGESLVRVRPFQSPFESDEATLDPRRWNGTDVIELVVVPHPSGHVLLVALLDNLGKGACGAAIQNLNLMLGLAERQGLVSPVS
jgi:N-acetyl-gamma-glutamyl-phosphate reductase